MHEVRHDINEKHSGETTSDVVVPAHREFSLADGIVAPIRKFIVSSPGSLPGSRLVGNDRQLLRTRDSRPVKPIVHTEGQRSAALLMVIVMLVYDPRPVPFPESAPAHSAGPTRDTDQLERPRRLRLACNISRNRALPNGYR